MRLISTLLLITIIMAGTGCEKDNDFSIADLRGNYKITRTKGINGNNDYPALGFIGGTLTFKDGGVLEYASRTNGPYTGRWITTVEEIKENCFTHPDGTETCDESTNSTLLMEVDKIPPGSGRITAYFEQAAFSSKNYFMAKLIINGETTHEVYFEMVQ